MVFEHRVAVRTAPLPIIRDHHSSQRYAKKNGASRLPPKGAHPQAALNGDSNNNSSRNQNNYQQKLINLFKGRDQSPMNAQQHAVSKPIAIQNSGKSNGNGHYSRMNGFPETPPIESPKLAASPRRGCSRQSAQQQHEQYNYRRRPLTIEEYENELRAHGSDLQLIERIFYGGFDSNKLRAALWPHIFGLVKHRGRFIKKSPNLSTSASSASFSRLPSSAPGAIARHQTTLTISSNSNQPNHHPTCGYANRLSGELTHSHTNGHTNGGVQMASGRFERKHQQREGARKAGGKSPDDNFIYIEHEENIKRWRELEKLYRSYESQWKSITADQESRFSVFRERKALIERDVIRSDRSHPFYADSSNNLDNFTALLMTYMMYDFDIGYLQGMSDLAAPILYVYQGDLVKSFWVFVEVMKLFRRNFEQSQKTIHFQLNCLYRLIKLTEPKLAYHLRDNDCSNCFFVFRCIVCQFKRELMKSRSSSAAGHHHPDGGYAEVLNLWDSIWSVQRRQELRAAVRRPTSASCPLTETEKFILSLCMSLIRRERDHILKCLDASEIHQHFINPHLTRNFDQFVDQAYGVYQYLNSDCDLQLLVRGADRLSGATSSDLSPICNDLLAADDADDETAEDAEPDTYDLLKDYLIISPTAYNIPSKAYHHRPGNNHGLSRTRNGDTGRSICV